MVMGGACKLEAAPFWFLILWKDGAIVELELCLLLDCCIHFPMSSSDTTNSCGTDTNHEERQDLSLVCKVHSYLTLVHYHFCLIGFFSSETKIIHIYNGDFGSFSGWKEKNQP